MTGSGSTLFAIYPSRDEADSAGGRAGGRAVARIIRGCASSPWMTTSGRTSWRSDHDQEQHRHERAHRRRRALQPGHRHRRDGLLLRPGRARPASGQLVEGGIGHRAERALRNLGAVLEAAGLGYADVVKTTCFLADIGDFAAFNEVYARFFAEPPPARSTFAVAALPKGARVEVEAVARSGRVTAVAV